MVTPEQQARELIEQAIKLLTSVPPKFDGLVPLPKAQQFVGYSPKAIRRKIEEGVWVEGKQYVRKVNPGKKLGRIWVNVPGVAEWSRSN